MPLLTLPRRPPFRFHRPPSSRGRRKPRNNLLSINSQTRARPPASKKQKIKNQSPPRREKHR